MKIDYPDWYRVEKEAALIINKLANLNDVIYYLTNPNKYIRRLAILRINQLRPKEAVNYLEQVLTDPLECLQNKKLAAWTLKAIAKEWKMELFLDNSLLKDFTGEESYKDLFEFTIIESLPSLDFSKFAISLKDIIPPENDYLLRNQEIDFEAPFSMKEWFKNLPILLWKYSKNLACYFWKKVFLRFFDYLSGIILRAYYKNRKSLNLIENFRQWGFKIVYLFFSPVRLLKRHKKLALVCTVGFYTFLVYTPEGQNFSLKYINVDLSVWQMRGVLTIKKILNNLGVIANVWVGKMKASMIWNILEEYIQTAIQLITEII